MKKTLPIGFNVKIFACLTVGLCSVNAKVFSQAADSLITRILFLNTATYPHMYGSSVQAVAKNNSAVGLGATGGSTLLAIKGSSSVGKVHEVAFNDAFNVYTRYTLTSNTWSPWMKFVFANTSNQVGIGTTDPATSIDIKGELHLGAITDLPAEGLLNEGDYGAYIFGNSASNRSIKIGVSNTGTSRAEIHLDNQNREDGTIALKTQNGAGGSVTRLFVDGNGLVSVGGTSGGKLSVKSAASDVSGFQFINLTSASATTAANGKYLSVDASGNVILTPAPAVVAAWTQTGNSGLNPSTNFIGTTDNNDLAFRTNNQERVRLLSNGNFKIGSGTDKTMQLQVNGQTYLSGAVGIGTDAIGDSNFDLFVSKGVRTRKVKVDLATWPDYVFTDRYELISLSDLERYIKENGHLPQVPAANEIKNNGLDLGDTQAVLLKKIEELTLYIIQQQKEIEELKKQMDQR